MHKNIFALALIIISLGFSRSANAATDFLKFPDLTVGQTSFFVKEVQKALNNNGFVISNVGVGSLGQESTYFGSLTKKALSNFQCQNSITPATGNFGPKTKAKLAEFFASGKFKGISSGKPVSLSGYVFGYVLQNRPVSGRLDFPLNLGVANRLYHNLSLDGYVGQPFGKCLQRSIFITDPTERSLCAQNENQDLFRLDNGSNDALGNVLVKNMTVKNSFRSGAAMGDKS